MLSTTVSIILIILNLIIIAINVMIIMKNLYRMGNRYKMTKIITTITIAGIVICLGIWLYLVLRG